MALSEKDATHRHLTCGVIDYFQVSFLIVKQHRHRWLAVVVIYQEKEAHEIALKFMRTDTFEKTHRGSNHKRRCTPTWWTDM